MKKELFLVIGAPGSGKTTACEALAQKEGEIAHFSTGDLLRAEIKSGSALGKTIEEIINKGDIVPVQIALQTIIKAIKNSTSNKVLIDGYPRSIEQMTGLEDALRDEDEIILKGVIKVEVSDKVAKKRVIGRSRGADDDLEVFAHRMRVYKEPLEEIEKFYKKKGILFIIDGEGNLKEVVNQLKIKIYFL